MADSTPFLSGYHPGHIIGNENEAYSKTGHLRMRSGESEKVPPSHQWYLLKAITPVSTQIDGHGDLHTD